MNKLILVIISFLVSGASHAQPVGAPGTNKSNAKKGVTSATQMPYNRLVQSAGKVITFGDPELENHALDIVSFNDKKALAVEHRYGLVIINPASNQIQTRWSFTDSANYKDLVSTYSGITSFVYQGTTYIIWGAQGGRADRGFVVIASVKGYSIDKVSFIPFQAIAPAKVALPNQACINIENNIPYLYVVLNGNNQLVKLNFLNNEIAWTASTGEAPYGICILKNKAYITNWGGRTVTDTTLENAGTPWGRVYTNPVTGATKEGSVSVIDVNNGKTVKELIVGLHPNAIIKSPDQQFVYVANSNSDNITVINTDSDDITDSINVGLFSGEHIYYGSSPNGMCISKDGSRLFVANGMDNAVAVVQLGSSAAKTGVGTSRVTGYIPTEAYPSGIVLQNNKLYVTNLEAKGSGVLSPAKELKQPGGTVRNAFTIHKELASVSIIPLPSKDQLKTLTQKVKQLNLSYRLVANLNQLPRKNAVPKAVPERIGEPSLFKHVIYIIKENKTYDQVYGDVKEGRGDSTLCVYGKLVTPNQHALTGAFSLMDNYFASGKSSAEGHQWTDAAMVSDYVERNVRAWFRSYPHRQEDALVYNKSGFIWNNALDHGKSVRIFGEACKTRYDTRMKWFDIYNHYVNHDSLNWYNTTTIGRIKPIIHPSYPDCDNFVFTDQLRADAFIKEWKAYEDQPGDSLPDLIVLSLPNDHTAGTSPDFPTPRAMVADNDLALGRIIETITNSRFWDSTVVFVIEDDSQSGWDHISPYRTTGLVISPYSALKTTVHSNYNQTCIVRTIEQILGIPPMNVIDATASPMFDCFTSTKASYRFQHLPNNIPLNEMNKPFSYLKGKALYYARLSKNSAFKELDGGDDDNMNRILWFDAKGDLPYPGAK
jgi:YVTN family beta-propeller protein